jgi:HAD superfamily hydrolase (TIGR01456 family)
LVIMVRLTFTILFFGNLLSAGCDDIMIKSSLVRTLLASQRRWSSTAAARSTHAVVFDVDGVLVLGNQVVPEAPAALQRLRAEGVPYLFMTNGGGTTEAKKAAALAEKFGVDVEPEQVVMCHTPMQALAREYGDRRVLVCGKHYGALSEICASYGFRRVVTAEELHRQNPRMYPDIAPGGAPGDAGGAGPAGGAAPGAWAEPFAAVLVMIDPLAWGRELQLCLDVLRSDGGRPGTLAPDPASGPAVPIFDACADFEYAADFPVPRLGAGSFRVALEALYSATTGGATLAGHRLQTCFGKPHGSSYAFAEAALDRLAARDGRAVHRIYGIGDNPETDIAGANAAGPRWRSVLTRGGIFQGGENDPTHPGDIVTDGVASALATIQDIEAQQR